MVRTLKSLGVEPFWYIPSDEGYGVHNEIIERYAKEGVTLIITVDCGISAVEETEFARGLGIDVVVTDHHEPPSTGIPKAVAVVDPKRQDSRYPFSELAGCAVSFKVAEALMRSFGRLYNQEMVAFSLKTSGDGTLSEIGAQKIRNEIALEQLVITLPSETAAYEREIVPALKKFVAFLGDAPLILHNAAFQETMLKNHLRRSLGHELYNRVFDTQVLARKVFPLSGEMLLDVAQEMKLETSGTGALDEALLTSIIFYRLEKLSDLRMDFFQKSHLDVVTLGTIADIMPLVRENRILVKQGLKTLAESRKVGVQMLLDRCVNRNRNSTALSAKSVSWSITPVLNSAGRRGKANLSAELLLTEDLWKAGKLLDEILKLNSERKELQLENAGKFAPLLEEQCDLEKDKIFIVTATGIEHGVTGIIASQIMRQYRRPTVLLIIEGNEAMGAARSVEGFDMVAALGTMSDILIKYGGHSQAAGLTVSVDKLDEFRRRLKEIAEKAISPELLVPIVEIDADLEVGDANLQLLQELSEMEPYGMGNPYPVFSLKKMKVREHGRVGTNGDHLKLRVSKNGSPMLAAIGWGLGSMEEDIACYPSVDLAVQLEMNVWQDKQNLQLLILDIRPND
jgi:single-stranded-DNA-specific exonuclease